VRFLFDRDYKNLEQVRPFMPAFLARYEELRLAGRYPYNDDFRGHPGISGDEDTAIYLCQGLRRVDEVAAKLQAALDDGYMVVEAVDEPVKCASVIYYGWERGGAGWKEWRDVRLVPGLTGIAVLPRRARTLGYNLLGGHLLVKTRA
jgi:hypothetical protein